MDFVTGMAIGMCVILCCVVAYLELESKKKKDALNDELKKGLEGFAATHNALVEKMAILEKQITENRLQVSHMQGNTKPSIAEAAAKFTKFV